ncbi:MAG: LD-carboxypeptidase [Aphanocapsa sp. GSE-SYN-MK-11-07L]|jgi:muramoyltetrapeptide carboxypeptidase|nr:LD-carboxypeptidase [Aphanocapsa sp. GSE-SYN-MK-11-07L]
MQPCQLPPPLSPGDRLWVINPSGAIRNFNLFNQGLAVWEQRGYRVELSPSIHHQWGYLAGSDRDRRQQLLAGLKDQQIKGILCGRGGYGGARLLEDWIWLDGISKWLIGFSDITSLLWSYAQQGVAGVHGPVLTTLGQEPDWSVQRLFDLVEGRSLLPLTGKSWVTGVAEGLLLPANLTVATHLLGTLQQPDLTGVILALEDVGEAPYRLDRMLTQWRSLGIFQQIKGIALGRFNQCQVPADVPSFTVEEVLRDRLSDLGIPIVADLPFGHDGVNAALPVGVPAWLDGDQGLLCLSQQEQRT